MKSDFEDELLALESIYGREFSYIDGSGDQAIITGHKEGENDEEERRFAIAVEDGHSEQGITLIFCLRWTISIISGDVVHRCRLLQVAGGRRRVREEVISSLAGELEVHTGCFAMVERARMIVLNCGSGGEAEEEKEEADAAHVDASHGGDHNMPLLQPQCTSLITTLHPDVLSRILSYLELHHIQVVSLVATCFASSLRANDTWLTLWSKRWPGETNDENANTISKGSFHARYAAEARLETLQGTLLSVRRLYDDESESAAVSGLAWLGHDGSHAAIATGARIMVAAYANLFDANSTIRDDQGSAGARIGTLSDGGSPDGNADSQDSKDRLLSRLECQDSKVLCLESSTDGGTLAAGMGNGQIKVWGRIGDFGLLDSGMSAQSSRHHKAAVLKLKLSTRHSVVVAGSQDSTLSAWRWETGGRASKAGSSVRRPCGTQIMRGHGASITCLSISDTTSYGGGLNAASGAANGTVKVWDCERGVCTFSSRNMCKVSAVHLANDWGTSGSQLLVAGLSSGGVIMYDPRAKASSSMVCQLIREYNHALLNPRFMQDWTLGNLLGHSLVNNSSWSKPGGGGGSVRDTDGLNGPSVSEICLTRWGLRLAVLDQLGTLSLFDLRNLGVSAKRNIGEETPGCDRYFTERQSERGGLRYTQALDWSAPSLMSKAQGFCDVVCRGGSCGMSADSRKVVCCSKEDGRLCCVDLKTEKVLKVIPEAMQVARGRWHTKEHSGHSTHMLWDHEMKRNTILVGSSRGLLGACELQFQAW